MSIREKSKSIRAENRQLLQDILRISDQAYGELVMDYAYRYLNMYLNGDAQAVRMLTLSTFFWEWWKNQWDYRNGQFVATWYQSLHRAMDEPGRKILLDLYKDHQNITPTDARPHPEVLNLITREMKSAEDLYEDMIRYVITNETKPKHINHEKSNNPSGNQGD